MAWWGQARLLSLPGARLHDGPEVLRELEEPEDLWEEEGGSQGPPSARGGSCKKLTVPGVCLALFVVGTLSWCKRLSARDDAVSIRGISQAAELVVVPPQRPPPAQLPATPPPAPPPAPPPPPPPPPTPPPTPAPPASFFCWSHMELGTYEVPLIKMQLVRRASIFACNEFAVISTEKYQIGDIGGAPVYTWVNNMPKVEMGKNGKAGQTTDSFLNTKSFLLAWDSLIDGEQIWRHDFVAKVDPDAVFFPDRLRSHVQPHYGQAVYFSNCGKWGGKVLLYGSLEVFSVPALHRYAESRPVCKALPWKGWGEDYYMQHCMDTIGIADVPDTQQVADDRCLGAPCSDWTKVAFHDFKDPEDWYKCFQEAIGETTVDKSLEMYFKK